MSTNETLAQTRMGTVSIPIVPPIRLEGEDTKPLAGLLKGGRKTSNLEYIRMYPDTEDFSEETIAVICNVVIKL